MFDVLGLLVELSMARSGDVIYEIAKNNWGFRQKSRSVPGQVLASSKNIV